MKRRDLLLGSAALGAGLALPRLSGALTTPSASGPATLKSLAAKSGLKLGVQASKAAFGTPSFVDFVIENFSLVTPGLELRWPRLHPTPTTYKFDEADWMVDFCQAHGLLIHGHNLCWNAPGGNPPWFSSVLTGQNARGYLTDYITTVMKRYSGRIESWDVVNEPIVSWSKRPDGLYPGIWLTTIGPQYIDIAFHAAQAADPSALRVLNCYNVEQESPEAAKTREQTLALLKQLLKRGVPVQAVGIESHLTTSVAPLEAGYLDFLKQVHNMGLQVLVTELDIDDSPSPGDTSTRDNLVGHFYYDYLTSAVPAGKINRVIFWTPSDRWNWLDSTNLPPRFRRADGLKHRTGLLDEALQKKAPYDAVTAALQNLSGSAPPSSRWSART